MAPLFTQPMGMQVLCVSTEVYLFQRWCFGEASNINLSLHLNVLRSASFIFIIAAWVLVASNVYVKKLLEMREIEFWFILWMHKYLT